MMKKKMLAVAVCVSMCMMAFAGCTRKSTSWRLAAGERAGVLLVGIGQYDTLR